MIWGYAEGYNFDLGVHEYQKVENPWSTLLCATEVVQNQRSVQNCSFENIQFLVLVLVTCFALLSMVLASSEMCASFITCLVRLD